MKNIKDAILESNLKRTPEFTKTYILIKALKDWCNYEVEQAKENDGANSPYVKSFTNGVEKFVKNTIMDGLEYMGDDTTTEIILAFSLNVNNDDNYDKIADELAKYILKK